MAPTGAITGRVTDENGQPIGHARVSALAPRVENGRRYLTVCRHRTLRRSWKLSIVLASARSLLRCRKA